jgi:CRISPR-associated protein Csd1
MTILQSLNHYYDRMAARGEAEAPGFSREKISFAIVLSPEGAPIDVVDLRIQSGKRLVPRQMEVPAAVKRTAGILPNRFWDKSSYVLGRTAGEGWRTAEEHAAFKALHRDLLAGSNDEGLIALLQFFEKWKPEHFDAPPFTPAMLDTNMVFRLDGDSKELHERAAAMRLLAAGVAEDATELCLVTGMQAPLQRLHPTVKGVQGAQSSGASLVSFNLDAFTSYGKQQGANAPVSEAVAFRYGAALNRMLDRGSRNRLQRMVGDATVVFWADASEAIPETAAAAAEHLFASWFDPPATAGEDENLAKDEQEAAKLRDQLAKVAEGRPEEADPQLRPGTRFHVLGLAPNAARLSVRYWLADDFSHLAKRLQEHTDDLRIEPRPRGWGRKQPSVNRLLVKTVALQEKFDNIPPLLAGEVMRAVLAGTPYPRTLLASAIIRLRAGDAPWTGWHAAVIKAWLNRRLRRQLETGRREGADAAVLQQLEKEILPVPLDPAYESPAYQLGRLFAVLESAQYVALGRVNAPIGDRYYAAASSTPARVFGTLLRGLKTHVADARKRNQGGWIEPRVAEILSRLPPDLPRTLRLEDQGRFAVGYYHERSARSQKDDQSGTGEASNAGENQ